jgi:thiamine monophosphate synthase
MEHNDRFPHKLLLVCSDLPTAHRINHSFVRGGGLSMDIESASTHVLSRLTDASYVGCVIYTDLLADHTIKLVEQIRSFIRTSTIPIVVICSDPWEKVKEVYRAGASYVIHKGINEDTANESLQVLDSTLRLIGVVKEVYKRG